MKKINAEITPYVKKLAKISKDNNRINPDMYVENNVFRGLRDLNGNGVVTGLTEISNIKAKEKNQAGESVPCDGVLSYRGINIRDIVNGFTGDNRFGFEEITYLLLSSNLPTRDELKEFENILAENRQLPDYFVRDMILKAPGNNMMNILARCVLVLYAYDENPDDISIENVLRQSLFLISVFPMLAVYAYQSFQHYHNGKSLNIHHPKSELSTAENILHLLRGEGNYTDVEAKILDLALVLHAEHGGGNNSSFTTHVVTSSGTDTYSAIAAALGSLKGPRHGGANIKVTQMFDDMKRSIDTKNEGKIADYLTRLLEKDAFDKAGLIYGMGHAIYSKSDPRADILKKCAKTLAIEKGREDDYQLYKTVSRLAPEIIASKRKMYKGVSPNVDFYSGMIYQMLDLPPELYTPIFAVARISGWCAHRMEEIQNNGKIIRPSYINVLPEKEYVNLDKR